jgi:hypothetical protein
VTRWGGDDVDCAENKSTTTIFFICKALLNDCSLEFFEHQIEFASQQIVVSNSGTKL